MVDHYSTLGVDIDASPEEIKKAHRREASKSHPDVGGDPEAFMAVQHAYETLSDSEKRRRYDAGEPEPPDAMQLAFNYVGNMFKAIIQDIDHRLFGADVIGKMREIVALDRETTRQQITQWEKRIVFFEKVKSRLSHKGARPNILTGILDQDVLALRSGIKSAEGNIDVLALVEGIVAEYEFERDAPQPVQPTYAQSGGIFNVFSHQAGFGAGRW